MSEVDGSGASISRTERRFWMANVAIVVAGALASVVAYPLELHGDVAMYLQIGRRVLAGEVLYVDLFELNPPLIMWLSAVPAGIADALGLNPYTLTLGLMAAWVGVAAAAFGRLAPAVLPAFQAAPALWAALALTAAYRSEAGERDWVFVITWLSFQLLPAAGWPGWARAAAGFGFGVVSALKPQFVAIVIGVEAVARLRSRRLDLHPEWAGFVAAGLAYVAALASMPAQAREHLFGELLPLLVRHYGAVGNLYADWPIAHATMWVALLLTLDHARRERRADNDLALRLAVWAVLAQAMYLQQGKFWRYHQFAALLPAAVASAMWVASRARSAAVGSPWALLAAALTGVASVNAAALAVLNAQWTQEVGASAPVQAALAGVSEAAVYSPTVLTHNVMIHADFRQTRQYPWDYPALLGGPADVPVGYLEGMRAELDGAAVVVVHHLCPSCPPGRDLASVLDASGVSEGLRRDFRLEASDGPLEVWKRVAPPSPTNLPSPPTP